MEGDLLGNEVRRDTKRGTSDYANKLVRERRRFREDVGIHGDLGRVTD